MVVSEVPLCHDAGSKDLNRPMKTRGAGDPREQAHLFPDDEFRFYGFLFSEFSKRPDTPRSLETKCCSGELLYANFLGGG